MENIQRDLIIRAAMIPAHVFHETTNSAREISKRIKNDIHSCVDKQEVKKAFYEMQNDIRTREKMYSSVIKHKNAHEAFHVFTGYYTSALTPNKDWRHEPLTGNMLYEYESAIRTIPLENRRLIAAYQPSKLAQKINKIKDDLELNRAKGK